MQQLGVTITIIGEQAFFNIELESVIIPNTIKTIGTEAFWKIN